MSYDFSHLSKDELIEELHIVDDMRIWRIAEAIRQGISYDEIHEITKIDVWFIDKLAILVEMEQHYRPKSWMRICCAKQNALSSRITWWQNWQERPKKK